jgi:hypothetical protein
MSGLLTLKQQQFNAAMEKFDKEPVYKWVGHIVSFVNVTSQFVLAVIIFQQSIGIVSQVLTFAAAYILADFVNGLVHLYMDTNDGYESPAGPFVASFHLHHRTPMYKQNPLVYVYYHESGSKIWLAIFMLIAVPCIWLGFVTGVLAYGALYFAILSCIAEVSHYLCHVPKPQSGQILGRTRILLSKRYHITRHHVNDNIQYTFLNGMTDPLVDLIAKKFFTGYKNTTDTHYSHYTGADTENRG